MTMQKITIAVPNSFVLIADSTGGSVPDPEQIARDVNITTTDSCVVVCCLPEIDGETEITLGRADSVDPGSSPAFEGAIVTPSRKVHVFAVGWDTLLELPVPSDTTRIVIWKNREHLPDRIVVGVE